MNGNADNRVERILFLDARSNTRFAPATVPVDVVERAFDLARWGPTSSNSTPLRVVAATSSGARDTVIACADENNRAKLARAPLLLVLARDDRYHDLLDPELPNVDAIRARLEDEPDRRARRAHENAYLEAGYLVVALRLLGLAVRPYGGFDRPALDSALLADTSWRSEILLGIGYPPEGDDGAGPRRRRPTWAEAGRVL
jgi:3-hydroxypropanoate dehydrogenase